MTLVANPTLPANGQDAIVDFYNAEILAKLAVINGQLDSNNIADGAISFAKLAAIANQIPASYLTDSANLEKYRAEVFIPFVSSGLIWSITSGLAGAMTTGVIYTSLGTRVTVASIASRTFTASKDTYVDISTSGSVSYTEVANGAASPTLTAGYIRTAIVSTNGTTIVNINQGQETQVAPAVSGGSITVTDTLGNLICLRDPNSKIIGYHEITSDAGTANSSDTQVPNLSVPIIVPTGRKLRITYGGASITCNSAGRTITPTIYDGVVGSGTKLQEASTFISAADASQANNTTVVKTLSPGFHTINAGMRTPGGTARANASTTSPSFLMVELL